MNIYYTVKKRTRNKYGYIKTKGEVYRVTEGELKNIGSYSHLSGGAGIEKSILEVCEKFGINTGGGYFKNWKLHVDLIEL